MAKKAKSAEDEFEAIAQRCIEEAEAVKCSFGEFVDGLKDITQALMDRWNMARSEQGQRGGDDE